MSRPASIIPCYSFSVSVTTCMRILASCYATTNVCKLYMSMLMLMAVQIMCMCMSCF